MSQNDGATKAKPSSKPRKTKKQSIFSDPLILTMAVLVVTLFVSTLAFVAVGLTSGWLDSPVPRTAAQSSLVLTGNGVEKSTEPYAWARYIGALLDNRQFLKANESIEKARRLAGKNDVYDNYLGLSQCQYYAARQDWKKLVVEGQKQLKATKDGYQKTLKSANATNANKAKAYGISDNYYEIELLLASGYAEQKQYKPAIKLLEDVLKKNGTWATVWASLGDAYKDDGNKTKAIQAYKNALKYLPDNEGIKKSLAELGAK